MAFKVFHTLDSFFLQINKQNERKMKKNQSKPKEKSYIVLCTSLIFTGCVFYVFFLYESIHFNCNEERKKTGASVEWIIMWCKTWFHHWRMG